MKYLLQTVFHLRTTARLLSWFVLCLFSFVFFLASCSPTESIFDNQELSLSVDAEVTETWITLSANPVKKDAIYYVIRDTVALFEGRLDKPDTLIHDENLEPSVTYTYSAFAQNGSDKSKTVMAFTTTMDTTSHDFNWEVFEFGAKGSSVFYDVSIISSTDIWCVGEIYTEDSYTYDSLGNWIEPYNAAHWNGLTWELMKIYFIYNSSNSWSPIFNILAFNSNDIWFGPGIQWDGNRFNTKPLNISFSYRVNKMWGTSSKDFYIVGDDGAIAYYNGQVWQKLDSSTEVDINDIWGFYDDQKGESYILCTVSYKYDPGDKLILWINRDNTITTELWPYFNQKPYSLWFSNKSNVFVAGDEVHVKNRLDSWKVLDGLPNYFKNSIRGKNLNDIMIAGEFLLLAHFNGQSWREYTHSQPGKFYSVDYKENIAVAVGRINNKAIIMMTN